VATLHNFLLFVDGQLSSGVLYDLQHDLLRQLTERRHLGNTVEVSSNESQTELFDGVKCRQILRGVAVNVDDIVNVDGRTQSMETQRLHTTQ